MIKIEALWQILRINNIGGTFLIDMSCMHANSLAYVRIKRGKATFLVFIVVLGKDVLYALG